MCGAGLAVLAAVSVSGGIRLERSRQEALKVQEEHVTAIAVVNMDDGVAVGDMQVNYAGQLLSFPNGHFTVTGLTDAKTGIENGKYAAYIVIPETFSASVTSVENDPAKVILSYQYNAKLGEEAKLQAVSDINSFMALFNSNIAYMYMDAIMAEFHRIQDDSATILANDNMELELIADIDASELIASAVPVEELAVSNDVQPVELAAYYSRNDTLLSEMQSNYSAAVQRGKEDYAAIKGESAAVGSASEKFFGLYDTTAQEMSAAYAQSLAEGQNKLSEAVGEYNQSVDSHEAEVREAAEKLINLQLEADREAAKNQLQKIVDDIKADISGNDPDGGEKEDTEEPDSTKAGKEDGAESSTADSTRENVSESGGEGEERKDFSGSEDGGEESTEVNAEESTEDSGEKSTEGGVEKSTEDAVEKSTEDSVKDNAEDSVEESVPEKGREEESKTLDGAAGDAEGSGGDTGDREEQYEIVLSATEDEEAVNSIVKETLGLFKMEPEAEKIDSVIQTYFVDAMSEENKRQMTKLSEEMEAVKGSMESYERRLEEFDPMRYIGDADLNAGLDGIDANAREMLQAVEENNSDYMLYASEMYTNTAEHTTQVKSALDEANTQTVKNVAECMNDLALSRAQVNSLNVDLLKGFTESLAYTKVGSRENVEVYDYIINPIMPRINGQAVTDADAEVTGVQREYSIKTWLAVMLGAAIFFCMAGITAGLRRQYGSRTKEEEELI